MKIYNHVAARMSALEMEMARHIPEGGNWQDIPEHIPSERLAQIRRSGGRTTYYGRMRRDRPSYTITTYFNRLGNGCNLLPWQDRVMSNREAARFQSFPDAYVFTGAKASQYKQIGNAVPPLLGLVISSIIKPHLSSLDFIDLFAGAGGLSQGFLMGGFNLVAASELEKSYFGTYMFNHKPKFPSAAYINGDITSPDVKEEIIEAAKGHGIGVIAGGPPCQGFSCAGWRDPGDSRNRLFMEFVSIVNELRPEFFVMENVPGILTMRKGDAVSEIVESFSTCGYHVNQPMKLNAEDYGVPQLRRRVFIIGSRKPVKISHPKPLFGKTETGIAPIVTVQDAIASLPHIEPGDDQMEREVDYTPSTPYDRLMNGDIDYGEFLESRIIQAIPGAKQAIQLSLLPE